MDTGDSGGPEIDADAIGLPVIQRRLKPFTGCHGNSKSEIRNPKSEHLFRISDF